MNNSFRIIGGKWRRQKLAFANIVELRPTPDRVRETVFNWLSFDIVNKKTLDLFAGSGSLSFEALSRGAKHAVLIEKSKKQCDFLLTNKKILNIDNIDIINQDALDYLKNAKNKFDIIFLDPPFAKNLITTTLKELTDKRLILKQAKIYLETEYKITHDLLDNKWEILKQKKAGQVHFCLIKAK